MKVLLDTHTFLWWITDDPRLSTLAREVMADGSNRLFLSAVSGWEIAIKAGLGRLVLEGDPGVFVVEQMAANAIEELPILMAHVLRVYDLPPHHRDPFDRLLVAQAQGEGLPVLTADPMISLYDVEVLW